MLVRIFDVPKELRTPELAVHVRRALADAFWLDAGQVTISFSPLPTSGRGKHGVLITGLSDEQMADYRMMVEVVSSACAPYFTEHGYLWYGCANPNVARKA